MTDGGELFPASVEGLWGLSRCQCHQPRQWGIAPTRIRFGEQDPQADSWSNLGGTLMSQGLASGYVERLPSFGNGF